MAGQQHAAQSNMGMVLLGTVQGVVDRTIGLCAHGSGECLALKYIYLASFPGHSQFFNVARRKRGRPGARSHVSYTRGGKVQGDYRAVARLMFDAKRGAGVS